METSLEQGMTASGTILGVGDKRYSDLILVFEWWVGFRHPPDGKKPLICLSHPDKALPASKSCLSHNLPAIMVSGRCHRASSRVLLTCAFPGLFPSTWPLTQLQDSW